MKTLKIASNGIEILVKVPFTSLVGANLKSLRTVIFNGFTSGRSYKFGGIRLYAPGSTFVVPTLPPASPTSTIAAQSTPYPVSNQPALVIESFAATSGTSNNLGGWHGFDATMKVAYKVGSMTISSPSSDLSWYSQFSAQSCNDISKYASGYLHIALTPSTSSVDFSIAIQEQNSFCDSSKKPSPANWEEVQMRRYLQGSDVYIPLSHFPINLQRGIGIALRAFTAPDIVTITRIEIVGSVPASYVIPGKAPQSPLVYSCTVPNTLAFGIDDGDPALASRTLQILNANGIKATFFVLGLPLLDPTTNMTNVYKEALANGHQVAVHSYTHPYFPTLTDAEIDYQMDKVASVVQTNFGITSNYFRPPFGAIDARSRQNLANRNMKTIMWSIDVEDYLWGTSSTPSKQLDAFNRDLNAGGSLVVMHYLYSSTVDNLQAMITSAKDAGKKIVRVDQCLGDPNAPPIV